ncbi:cadmium-induced protein AS8-like isoform X2 [Primulina huaijiensis]|uniref:cadmium-induced protein AS8-like isoform X2 n=1 Tax=Primulina huaijiensis TaxID=1492673 RepID=UPI003CC72AC2
MVSYKSIKMGECQKVKMIIKSIFRRYERWNPVHPTYGAFWGAGIGIGCGVGWGPGFGPEVIGYVGSGCGIGFNVGFTLLGFGIGLPTNYIFTVPHNAFMVTRMGTSEAALARGSLANRAGEGVSWDASKSGISDVQQNLFESFSSFKFKNPLENGLNLPDMRIMLISRSKPKHDCLQRLGGSLFPGDRGSKN